MNDRHNTLTQAGWIYDQQTDYYRKPGSASDGTAKQYNLDAAWQQYQADQLDSANTPTPPKGTPTKGTRQADPRAKEPE